MWNEHNCIVVWTLFGIALLWYWNENWPFPALWSLLSFPNLLTYWVQHSLVAQMVKYLLQCGRCGFHPWVRKIPWRRKWQSTPVFFPREFHEWWNLAGYSQWGQKELDTTECLHFLFFECNTLTASSFKVWNSSAAILPPPLALFMVVFLYGPLDFTLQDVWL